MTRTSAVIGSAFLAIAEAWSQDGHAIIAHVADDLLDPEVSRTLLADLGKENLSQAAVWCDDFDHSDEGRWSEPLHFINYPEQTCSFDWQRDCKDDWCNVGALSNYTKQVWDTTLSAKARLMALNFMIHMTGDLHQPLHVASGGDRGGNAIRVSHHFNNDKSKGRRSNLHSVWDSAIILQMIDDYSASRLTGGPFPFHHFQLIVDDILKHVKGEWAGNATEWRRPVTENRNDASLRAGLAEVASQVAAAGCEYAYARMDGTLIQSGDELGVDYYQRSKPVVFEQLAKGGVRLAEILKDSLTTRKQNRIITI